MSVGQVRKAEAVFAGLRKKDGALKAEVKVYEGVSRRPLSLARAGQHPFAGRKN